MNTDLIISHVAYNMVSVPDPFTQLPDKIYMTKRDNTLDEVVIIADSHDPYSREIKLKAFKKEFFGDTKVGRSCFIKNEEDIRITYNSKERRLIAFSDVPLVIYNEYLGYEVLMLIIDFYAEYSDYTKDLKVADKSFFVGVNMFTDLAPDDKKIKERRQDVYKKSYVSFFKNLADNTLDSSDFRLYNGKGTQVKTEDYFEIIDESSMKKIKIIAETDILGQEDEQDMYGAINIVRNKREQSTLRFFTDSFIIDQFGNTDAVDKLLLSGVMGGQRFGYMLPLDYNPEY